MSLNIEHLHRVHCIGIGGIGVSAVAKFLRLQGKMVSGSDLQRSEITEDAERAGVIIKDEDPENISVDLDLIVYTSAAPEEHPERTAAAKLGIPQLSYFEFLGLLSRSYETIAIAGTNGKSTTTAILGLLLEAGGLDPLVIVGSRVGKFPYGNLRNGKGNIFVVEACEHEAQLLHLSPKQVIITNTAEDHLDFYRDLGHIQDTFQEFVNKLPKDGLLVTNAGDANSSGLEFGGKHLKFGINDGDYFAKDIRTENAEQKFTVVRKKPNEEWQYMKLKVPGRFNIENALAAAVVAREMGVSVEVIRKTLSEYAGIWRRFEIVGKRDGAPVISDYGHHPDAVKATLKATREFFPGRRVVLVFQPHHHDRTKKLFDDFVESLTEADVLVLSEVYSVAGRPESEGDVSSKDLVDAIKAKGKRDVWYSKDVNEAEERLKSLTGPDDVILIMGAGSIYSIAERIVK